MVATTLAPDSTNLLLAEYTAALRSQLELEHQALAVREREVRLKEDEVAALRDKTRIEQQRVEEFMVLAQEIRTLTEKVGELHAVVMSYTDDYITSHHKPIMQEIKWLASRVEVIMQLFSAVTPEILRSSDPRLKEMVNKLFYLLEHPTAVTVPSVNIQTGDVDALTAVERR